MNGFDIYRAKDPGPGWDRTYVFAYSQHTDKHGKGSWRARILRTPKLGTLKTDRIKTHRWVDAEGKSYVSWSEPVRSAADMKAIAHAWADMIQEQIGRCAAQ